MTLTANSNTISVTQVAHFCAPYGKPGISYLPERDIALAKEEGYRSFATTVRGNAARRLSLPDPAADHESVLAPLAVLGRLHSGSPAVPGWS